MTIILFLTASRASRYSKTHHQRDGIASISSRTRGFGLPRVRDTLVIMEDICMEDICGPDVGVEWIAWDWITWASSVFQDFRLGCKT